ncbi:MAG: energy-coupling factor transporter transmembrane protein EcfT [Clostridia bacterium]|nr:energy-coupling factor transporter transmembrane protein EcfT [Clostridia bacterium]
MRAFEDYNPIVISLYFLSVIGILMFSQNPVLLVLGFLGALGYFASRCKAGPKRHIFYLVIFLVLMLLNPLVSHNGKTILFFINNSPITLEATVYGAVSAGSLLSVLYWFSSFSEIMTRDKLLYVFGRFSPRLALVMSMGLRYVVLLRERARIIRESQRALGLYRDDNIFDKIRGDLRVFSILITWALENGIITADSMSARGYGDRKRTHYSTFKLGTADVILLVLTLVCGAVSITGIALGSADFEFYPTLRMARINLLSMATYIAYGILVFIPIFTQAEERIKWRYLQSKI